MNVTVREASATREARVGEVVVLTHDDELLDQVLAIAASAGVEASVLADAAEAQAAWLAAALVVVGVDLAPPLLAQGLPRRREVYVVGPVERQPELAACSAPLGAAVAALPDAAVWLTAALVQASGSAGGGRTVAVVGAVGGAGASTLASALAAAAVRGGRSVFLIDTDPWGGGLDLLLGAERVNGWRWPRLAHARGQVGDLRGHVVRIDGIDVLAHGREEASQPIAPGAVAAVLGAAARSHDLVVVDLPRSSLTDPTGREALQFVDKAVWLVPARVRAVAAARQLHQAVASSLTGASGDQQGARDVKGARATGMGAGSVGTTRPQVGAAVRTVRGGLDAETVAAGLGLPHWVTVGDDTGLLRAAERGEPPGRLARSPLGRAADRLLDQLVPVPSHRRRRS